MTNVVPLQSISRSRLLRSGNVTMYQSENSQKPWRLSQSPTREQIAEEMREIVRMAGEDGGPVAKGCVALAARRLGLTFSKTHRIWYGQVCAIPAHEADMLRAARGRILAERARRLQGQLDVVNARLRAIEGGRDEAVA